MNAHQSELLCDNSSKGKWLSKVIHPKPRPVQAAHLDLTKSGLPRLSHSVARHTSGMSGGCASSRAMRHRLGSQAGAVSATACGTLASCCTKLMPHSATVRLPQGLLRGRMRAAISAMADVCLSTTLSPMWGLLSTHSSHLAETCTRALCHAVWRY